MINRIRDHLAEREAVRASSDPAPVHDPKRKKTFRVKLWVEEHPLPCLAAVFVVGACVAWLVKRK